MEHHPEQPAPAPRRNLASSKQSHETIRHRKRRPDNSRGRRPDWRRRRPDRRSADCLRTRPRLVSSMQNDGHDCLRRPASFDPWPGWPGNRSERRFVHLPLRAAATTDRVSKKVVHGNLNGTRQPQNSRTRCKTAVRPIRQDQKRALNALPPTPCYRSVARLPHPIPRAGNRTPIRCISRRALLRIPLAWPVVRRLPPTQRGRRA
jgi:hypothetical protein